MELTNMLIDAILQKNKYKIITMDKKFKRLIGMVFSPIVGNLSPEVRGEIFEEEPYQEISEYSIFYSEIFENFGRHIPLYEPHWGNKASAYVSIITNLYLTGLGIPVMFPNLDYQSNTGKTLMALGIYKMIEGGYRAYKDIFSQKVMPGSLEGTLISKALIEPFFKKGKLAVANELEKIKNMKD